jgi:hypothetical protein
VRRCVGLTRLSASGIRSVIPYSEHVPTHNDGVRKRAHCNTISAAIPRLRFIDRGRPTYDSTSGRSLLGLTQRLGLSLTSGVGAPNGSGWSAIPGTSPYANQATEHRPKKQRTDQGGIACSNDFGDRCEWALPCPRLVSRRCTVGLCVRLGSRDGRPPAQLPDQEYSAKGPAIAPSSVDHQWRFGAYAKPRWQISVARPQPFTSPAQTPAFQRSFCLGILCWGLVLSQ